MIEWSMYVLEKILELKLKESDDENISKPLGFKCCIQKNIYKNLVFVERKFLKF